MPLHPAAMAKTDLFNPRKAPRLLRTYISLKENIISVFLLLLLIGIIFWVKAQKNNYNSAERDIPIELLNEGSTNLKLYNPPLKRWSESGSSSATSAAADLGLLPASIVDAQWQPKTGVKQFNADNLFEKINGEAPKFLRQGFQSLNYLVLSATADASEIAIELYDQNDMAGSRGIFSEHLSPDKTIEEYQSVTFFRTSVGVIGRVGQYFFRVAGDNDSTAIQQKSQQLIEAFATLEPQQNTAAAAATPVENPKTSPETSAEPVEFRLLAGLGVPSQLISFQSENVFQFDFAQNFWFGKFAQDDITQVFIHKAASADAAQELYDQLLEEQSYDYKTVDEEEVQVLLFHEFLKNFFALKLHKDFIIGVENAADREKATALLQQLEEALTDYE
jgi:hypothetical protein